MTEGRRLPLVPALDGLRGVAIALVLAYHLGSWLPGGFLGVDLFFTLSGFLITTILLADVRERRIDLRGFWAQRARRLLPALCLALAAVVLVQLARGPAGLLPGLRAQITGTLLYVSNWVQIAQDTSYFDQFAEPSPLRHTWSLAIEEQFYLVWPLVLALLLRWSSGPLQLVRRVLVVALAGALASAVAMALLFDPVDSSRAYYGTDTHASPILIGCAAACLRLLATRRGWTGAGRDRSWPGQIASLTLLGGLVYATAVVDEGSSGLYRGGFALIAVLCAWLVLLVVLGGADACGVLSWRPLRWVGERSYGIYLAHWIVIVYVTEEATGLDGTGLAALRIGITLAAAALSYRVLEDPIRHQRTTLPARLQAGLAATVGMTLLVVAVGASGLDSPPPLAGGATNLADALPSPGPPPSAPAPAAGITNAPKQLRLFVVGDSIGFTFALHWPRDLAPDVTIGGAAALGCRLQTGEVLQAGEPTGLTTGCPGWRTEWRTQMRVFAPDVVLAFLTAWEAYDAHIDGRDVTLGSAESEHHLMEVLDTLRGMTRASGARLALVVSPPMIGDGVPRGTNRHPDEQWRVAYLNDLYRAYARRHADEVGILDLQATLCPTEPCSYELNGVTVLPDHMHFDARGAEMTALTVLPALRRLAP